MKKVVLLCFLWISFCTYGYSIVGAEVVFKQCHDEYILRNSQNKVICRIEPNGIISQHYFAKDKNGIFKELVASFVPDNSLVDTLGKQMYNTHALPLRYLMSEIVDEVCYDKHSCSLILSGYKDGIRFQQSIQLQDDNNVYNKIECTFPEYVNSIDYVLSSYVFNANNKPYFVHTPCLKFDNEESKQNRFRILSSAEQIIGDRAFHAPALIMQDGTYFAALYPDLEVINDCKVVSPDARRINWIGKNKFCVPEASERFTLPTALDFSINSNKTSRPLFSFGYADAIIGHHMHFNRPNDSTMVRHFYGNKLTFAYTLKIKADADVNTYQCISQEIWAKYGHKEFVKHPHLAMPFDEYYYIINNSIFNPKTNSPIAGYKNMGDWLEWEEKDEKMGGFRSAIDGWNCKMHNSLFWNNAREAIGFWYWGKRLHSASELEKARRIINWCLSAPQNKYGLFPILYDVQTKEWALQSSDPMKQLFSFFNSESSCYDVASMSKTGAYLLKYYLNCEKDKRIVDYLLPYGNWLITSIDDKGTVPAYVSKEMENSDILRYSAHSAASLWFLAELYNATKRIDFLEGAIKLAGFIEKEIIPMGKWIDFEQFFSCGSRPLFFERDVAQNQFAKGNLSLIWAAEGFAALHRATIKERFLKAGVACVDYLAFTQCSWNPHYIYTAYPFGGFGVDNADCTAFLDARQAEAVSPFIYFGKVLGRLDLLERAVAAARASVVLINHPRHVVNNIYRYPNIYPVGLGPENIDHEGVPQSAMRTHASWGEGSGVYTALAELLRNLGGIYINPQKNIILGVDGIKIKRVSVSNRKIDVEIESFLSSKYLKQPWSDAYNTNVLIEDGDGWVVNVNGVAIKGMNEMISVN